MTVAPTFAEIEDPFGAARNVFGVTLSESTLATTGGGGGGGGGGGAMFRPAAIRPIWLPWYSVNQSALSGPSAIVSGSLPGVGTVNSVMLPPVVIRPILLAPPR